MQKNLMMPKLVVPTSKTSVFNDNNVSGIMKSEKTNKKLVEKLAKN